ncbi:MAG: 1-acyl-sn-glycerol-3-phosphate acyltransferase [Lachnospiraceae bacterium]|nr:1-acyl-sn-glycerol-3-phosphate acyltransferase [Lachnospiraceae bacterium]
MKAKKKWMKPRHTIVRNLAIKVIGPYCRMKYGITIETLDNPEKRPYLILMNHQTAFDQFFIGMAFRQPVYYLASEDIFSLGWISKVLSFLVAPIPIKKQTTDLNAIKTCVKISKEGGTIALFPEGNRTYHGRTLYFKPSIVKLIRLLKLPLALFRVEGGYGIHPRWSDVVRKGKMKTTVAAVLEPQEYALLSDDELYNIIQENLYVDEHLSQENFYHKKSAEHMERFLYICPHCGLTKFQTKNDLVWCQSCNQKIQYLPNKKLAPLSGAFPFAHLGEWYDYQCSFVSSLSLADYLHTPIDSYEVKVFQVILYEKKQLLHKKALLRLYGNRLEIDAMLLPFDQLSAITILGKNKINIYHKDLVYQIKADSSFNGLKYVNIYHHYINSKKGDHHEQFLGL